MTHKQTKQLIKGKQFIWIMAGVLALIITLITNMNPVKAADVVVYKTPTCGCCKDWVKHLENNGFTVEVHDMDYVSPLKTQMGIPNQLQSCHTAKVGDYFVEGHVPAKDIKRLLQEKPDIAGLTVPGMPMGSPGMEGPRTMPYNVLGLKHDGSTKIYARYNQE
jgi:hypothetical protein